MLEKILGEELEQAEIKVIDTEGDWAESENQYRSLLQDLPLLICCHRPIGGITFANKAFCEYFDKTPEELLGQSFFSLFSESDRQAITASLSLLTPQTPKQSYEHRVTAPDDEVRWLQWTNRALFDARGKVIQYNAIAQDITDRRRAEELIDRERNQFKQMIDSLPGKIYLFDRNGQFLLWNGSLGANTGYSAEEMLQLHPMELFRGHDRHLVARCIHEVFETGRADVQADLVTKDGSSIPFYFTGNRVEYNGRPCIMGMGVDITKLKQARDALRESEQRLRLAVTSAQMGAWDMDLRSYRIHWSDEYGALCGRTREQFPVDVPAFFECVHPDDHKVVRTSFNRAVAENVPYKCDFRVICPDGSERWHSVSGQVIRDENGHPFRMIGVGMDITERKHAEIEKERLRTQLNQAQRIESIGRLAGGVAHDFNNMLSVIIGHAELVMEQVNPAASIYGDLEEIQKAAKRSSELTRQLLAFARRQVTAPEVLDLNQKVSGTIKMLGRLIGEDIALTWIPGEGLWPVKIDPAQVDQLLANLSVNARDAIEGAGKITIETQNVFLDEGHCAEHAECQPGPYVMLKFSDNGCGMEQDILANIFDPFFTTKAVGEGTGLGLSIIYGIVKQNRGYIDVESRPGGGTKFKIYLARAEENLEKNPASDTKLIPTGTETVLLVEDEKAVLQLAKTVLARLGYKILAAEDSGEAIHLVERYRGPIHLLVTDVVMPEMNGLELKKRIENIVPAVRTLFISGYPADILASRGFLDEDLHYLQKPFSIDVFAEKVRNILNTVAK